MIVCKDDTAYKCTEPRIKEERNILLVHIAILEPITREEIVDMFTADKSFYFYDDVLNCRLPVIKDEKIIGLIIQYKVDSTCNVTIKLSKGEDEDES